MFDICLAISRAVSHRAPDWNNHPGLTIHYLTGLQATTTNEEHLHMYYLVPYSSGSEEQVRAVAWSSFISRPPACLPPPA